MVESSFTAGICLWRIRERPNPNGRSQEPRRDAAFALLSALALCTLLYTTIQWAVVGILPDPAHSARPLADTARTIFGGQVRE